MDTGELLTRWTARVAVVLYIAGLAMRADAPRWSRLAWTAGCGVYLAHVLCAFGFIHHWSQAEAYAFVAAQTAAVTGLDWGGGLYVNYAFTLVWLVDVCWRWTLRPPPRWLAWSADAFLAFIVVNATVVFATGFSRWLGIVACVLLAVIWFRRYRFHRRVA
jgi:hypothetical protein